MPNDSSSDDNVVRLLKLAEKFLDVQEGETFSITNRSLAAVVEHLLKTQQGDRNVAMLLSRMEERIPKFRQELMRAAHEEKVLLPDGETLPFVTRKMVEDAIAKICPPPPERPH